MKIITPRLFVATLLAFILGWNPISAQAIRILPMGDSITFGSGGTAGLGGYRGPLYDLLVNAGHTIDYVGTSTGNSDLMVDMDHEGHGGWRIDQLDANVASWFDAIADPDIILLHIGTNDFGQGVDITNAINRLDALITKMAGLRPNAHIIVTNLMERGEPRNAEIQTHFNPFVQGVVDGHVTAGNLVSFLDMRSAVPLSDMPDNLHPNQTGYGKMAAAWVGAIEAVLEPGDAVPPSIVRALGTESRNEVVITFNKRVDEVTAETISHYAISGGVDVLSAERSVNERVVTLTTTVQVLGSTYTLTVNGIQDQVVPTPNTIAADSTAPFFPATRSGYFHNVDEAGCYTLVYSLEIPSEANFSSGLVPYDIDYRNRVGSFDRIAYYLELEEPGGDLQYAWTSMDAFATSLDEIGVPVGGAVFQQPVSNLSVASNVPGVATGSDLDGNIEFWSTNFGAANAASVPGASDAVLDFGDSKSTGGNYGSMQIHNTTGAQTVIAFSRWGGFGGVVDLGIGNNPNENPDWTFAQNAAGFTVKKIQVLVRTTGDLVAPTLVSAEANFAGTGLTVRFSEPVRPETLVASNFVLDGGVTVLGVSVGDDLHEVFLETTAHSAAVLTLTVNNVRDTSQNANQITPASMIAVAEASLPAEVVANIGASADGYELVYTLEIPTTGNFNAANPYTVDDSGAGGSFSRIAYYLELQEPGGPVEYVWAAMDAFTASKSQIGVPTLASGAVFQQAVTNLDVISNAAGVVNGTALPGGHIEFWPTNYSAPNAVSVPGASDTVYDFGDTRTDTGSYGSMQVHNSAASQTLFAMNHWGGDGNPLCLGIGNQGTSQPDWTFADNAGTYTRRVLHVMVLPTPQQPVPAEVLANIPESADYELVYSLDIPANGNLSGGAGFAPYSVDQSGTIGSFSRVAYYLELQKTGDPAPTFAWVSMDAFTGDRSKIGVPNLNSGAVFQQFVTNLNVVSNSGVLTTGTGLSGNLEFWPSNYNGENTLPVSGASGTAFDFGDNPTPGNYGSMQVHNPVAGETIFAINRWGATGNTTNALCVGIGTNPAPVNNGFDYTFANNAPSFDLIRRLHVFVLPGASPFGGPEFIGAVGSTTRDRLVVRFDREVADASAAPGNFTIDGGVSVTGAVLLPGNREIVLTTSGQAAGVSYTVTAGTGVIERSASGTPMQVGASVPFTAYTPPAALANVPDSGYELIYQLAIPDAKPRWNVNPVTYSVDEALYGERLFDRVAYLMELDGDWVYASFDPHTDRIAQIGVPSQLVTPTPFQQIVTNMNVDSNFPGIITGDGIMTGNIEFWGGNYQQANGISIPNAAAATFDFGDTMTPGGHGSMQIHNHEASQTLFSYNNWGSNSGGVSDTGIGNNTTGTGDPDWTFSDSASNWTTRTLYVLVRPGGTASGEAPEILSHPCGREVVAGGDVTFAVGMLGDGPFTYQWRCNGAALSGQTLSWLELSDVSAADVAAYDVVVTGPNLVSVTSQAGLLTLAGTPPTSLELWRIANGFHPADGSTPGDGDLEDREGDRLANLLEFAFGTDPNASDNLPLAEDGSRNGTPSFTDPVGGGAGVEALFIRRDDFGQPGSLVYTVEFSGDLVTFHPNAAAVTIVRDSTDDADYHVASVPYPDVLPDGKMATFHRVRVEEAP